jgi:hypothetical protein
VNALALDFTGPGSLLIDRLLRQAIADTEHLWLR